MVASLSGQNWHVWLGKQGMMKLLQCQQTRGSARGEIERPVDYWIVCAQSGQNLCIVQVAILSLYSLKNVFTMPKSFLFQRQEFASTIGQKPISWRDIPIHHWSFDNNRFLPGNPIPFYHPPGASGASLAASSTSLSNSASTSRRSGGLGVGKRIFGFAKPILGIWWIQKYGSSTIKLFDWTSFRPVKSHRFYQQESGFLPANIGELIIVDQQTQGEFACHQNGAFI